MPFVSKTLQYSFCTCVRNIFKIVMFVIEKMTPPPPPQTQDALWTIGRHYINILHVWRENTMIYQTNKIGNFVFV